MELPLSVFVRECNQMRRKIDDVLVAVGDAKVELMKLLQQLYTEGHNRGYSEGFLAGVHVGLTQRNVLEVRKQMRAGTKTVYDFRASSKAVKRIARAAVEEVLPVESYPINGGGERSEDNELSEVELSDH